MQGKLSNRFLVNANKSENHAIFSFIFEGIAYQSALSISQNFRTTPASIAEFSCCSALKIKSCI